MPPIVLLTALVWTLCCLAPGKVSGESGKKPYHIQLDRFEPFSNTEKEFWDPGTLRIARKARNHFVLSGEFSMFKNFGDDILIKYFASRKNSNGKYTQIKQGSNTVCAQIVGDDKYYPMIAENSNLPMPAPCPFPKGTYKINNFEVSDDFLPQVLMPGEYSSEVQFIMDGAVLCGYKIFITILPG